MEAKSKVEQTKSGKPEPRKPFVAPKVEERAALSEITHTIISAEPILSPEL